MEERIDTDKVMDWLNRQWQGPKLCPICNNNRWGIGGRPVQVSEFSEAGPMAEDMVYPLIAVTCGVCGYTLLFNAIVTGLVEAKRRQNTPPPDTEESEKQEEEHE